MQLAGLRARGVGVARQLEVLERGADGARPQGEAHLGEAGGAGPGGIPSGLGEALGGLVEAAEALEGESEAVTGLAGYRVEVATRHAGKRALEQLDRNGVLASAVVDRRERGRRAVVGRVAAQRLLEVRRGAARGVAVLLEVQAGEVQLVLGVDLGGQRRLGRRPRHDRLGRRVARLPAQQHLLALFDQ